MKSARMQLELTISWAPRTGEMCVVFLLPGGAPQEFCRNRRHRAPDDRHDRDRLQGPASEGPR